jgi:hypothetical protein
MLLLLDTHKRILGGSLMVANKGLAALRLVLLAGTLKPRLPDAFISSASQVMLP